MSENMRGKADRVDDILQVSNSSDGTLPNLSALWHRMSFLEAMTQAAFDVYGLPLTDTELETSNFGYVNTGTGQITQILLTFVSKNPNSKKVLDIVCNDANSPITHPKTLHSLVKPLHDTELVRIFARYNGFDFATAFRSTPNVSPLVLNKATMQMQGELLTWGQNQELGLFQLFSNKTVLTGTSCGFTKPELEKTLGELVLISGQNDLLSKYNNELIKNLPNYEG
jgi:hypothetical protein